MAFTNVPPNSSPNLPPQAYTRDVLATAYEWLRSQPASIRELATSSDNLVSLYMQSRRRPNALNQLKETPAPMSTASAEAFKNDLKNLAEGMKQFEDSSRPAAPVEAPPMAMPDMTFVAPTPTMMYAATPAPQMQAPASQPLALDSRSLDAVRKVQSLFNLSNEREALRLLISVGLEKVKDIISGS